MADKTPTIAGDPNILLNKVTWAGMANTDVGVGPDGVTATGFKSAEYMDRSFQVKGTFGVGGTMLIEGSNDGGTTWATLNDAFGNALSFTTAGIKQVTEMVEMIRPRVSAGDGTTALAVIAYMRKMPD
jgi:hypothetical protein